MISINVGNPYGKWHLKVGRFQEIKWDGIARQGTVKHNHKGRNTQDWSRGQ